MKYTVVINQVGIAQAGLFGKGKTDLYDWAILDYLFDWREVEGADVIQDESGKRFVWCSYDHLLSEMPALAISKSALSQRISKLRGLGLVETIRRNQRLYVHVTQKAANVRFYNASNQGVKLAEQGVKLAKLGVKPTERISIPDTSIPEERATLTLIEDSCASEGCRDASESKPATEPPAHPEPSRSLPAAQPDGSPGGSEKKPTRPRKRRRKPPSNIPPAVAAFRSASYRYPPRAVWPDIVKAVGSKREDVERWKQVVHAWVIVGWNKMDVGGMLEYYMRNEIPKPGRRRRDETKRLGPVFTLADAED